MHPSLYPIGGYRIFVRFSCHLLRLKGVWVSHGFEMRCVGCKVLVDSRFPLIIVFNLLFGLLTIDQMKILGALVNLELNVPEVYWPTKAEIHLRFVLHPFKVRQREFFHFEPLNWRKAADQSLGRLSWNPKLQAAYF